MIIFSMTYNWKTHYLFFIFNEKNYFELNKKNLFSLPCITTSHSLRKHDYLFSHCSFLFFSKKKLFRFEKWSQILGHSTWHTISCKSLTIMNFAEKYNQISTGISKIRMVFEVRRVRNKTNRRWDAAAPFLQIFVYYLYSKFRVENRFF